jgi:hypothetical protein
MRKLFAFAAAALASLPLAAQQPQPQQQPKQDEKAQPQQQVPQQSESETERVRADGAAGGTRPLAPEKRKAVGAGAGPHLEHVAPAPQKLPRDEPVQPDK